MSGIPPLVKIRCGLIILEASNDWTVYNNLRRRKRAEELQSRLKINYISKTTSKISTTKYPCLCITRLYLLKCLWTMLVQIPTTRWCEAYGAGEKRSGFECLPECADMPFHYLFNSLWIPQRRGEDRRPCQGGSMH